MGVDPETERLEVPDILLPDIRGLLKRNMLCVCFHINIRERGNHALVIVL